MINVKPYKKAIVALGAAVVGVFALFDIDVSKDVQTIGEIALVALPVVVYQVRNG